MTVVHCTYDPETKSGSAALQDAKVKGTIHWVAKATMQLQAEVRLYENIVDEAKGSVYNEDGSVNINPNSLTVLKDCCLEPNFERCSGRRQLSSLSATVSSVSTVRIPNRMPLFSTASFL